MILAIDTATRWTGLALHEGTAVLAELGWYGKNTQTIELAPAVADLFRKQNVAAVDLTGVAVAIGPGSYTGLRVGLGVAKGLALAHQIPLYGIPTLDILAAGVRGSRAAGRLIAVAKAGRRRITIARYQWRRTAWQRVHAEPVAYNVSWQELLADLDGPTTFAGEISAEAARRIRDRGKHLRVVNPASSVRRASALAELGWLRQRQGEPDDARTLTPIYLRKPDGS